MIRLLKIFPVAVAILLLALPLPVVASESKVVYLVRHAEKASDGTKNPHLTEQGRLRAIYIAKLLKKENIQKIFSTDYHRTQETASPLAKKMKLKVVSYDPYQLAKFAEEVKQLKENVLVVGHSNTTPSLVEFLGGDSHGEIDESDYSRLYRLTFTDNKVSTNLITITPQDFLPRQSEKK